MLRIAFVENTLLLQQILLKHLDYNLFIVTYFVNKLLCQRIDIQWNEIVYSEGVLQGRHLEGQC